MDQGAPPVRMNDGSRLRLPNGTKRRDNIGAPHERYVQRYSKAPWQPQEGLESERKQKGELHGGPAVLTSHLGSGYFPLAHGRRRAHDIRNVRVKTVICH